jgi:hypothetical protein
MYDDTLTKAIIKLADSDYLSADDLADKIRELGLDKLAARLVELATQPAVTLTRAVQTCWACPSQWDAWDADGRYYYLRYRSGHGSVRADGARYPVADFDYGDSLDGFIELEKFAELAGIRLELS